MDGTALPRILLHLGQIFMPEAMLHKETSLSPSSRHPCTFYNPDVFVHSFVLFLAPLLHILLSLPDRPLIILFPFHCPARSFM